MSKRKINVEININPEKIYDSVSEDNGANLNIFLEQSLKDNGFEAELGVDGYSTEQTDRELIRLITKTIEGIE